MAFFRMTRDRCSMQQTEKKLVKTSLLALLAKIFLSVQKNTSPETFNLLIITSCYFFTLIIHHLKISEYFVNIKLHQTPVSKDYYFSFKDRETEINCQP